MILTLVACIAANETTVAMFPAVLHGVSRLSVFSYILFHAATAIMAGWSISIALPAPFVFVFARGAPRRSI